MNQATVRKRLWIVMSDLWLDQELTKRDLDYIAQAVRDSGLSTAELDKIFELELAPFLGLNHLTPLGVWTGFNPDWVCEKAQERFSKYRLRDRIFARLGITTYAARPSWERVKTIAFE